MGWLTKIFKGSSHKLWEGQHHGKHGEETWQRPASTNGDALSDFDAEEIDRAIALSLAEEEARAIAEEERKSVSEKDDKSVAGDDERSVAGEDERSVAGEDERSVAGEDDDDDTCIAEDDELSIAGESETSTEEDHQVTLEENDQKGKKVIEPSEDNSYLEEDEQLAKALQESLNVGTPPSPPRYDYGNFLPPYQFFYPSGYRICAGCKTEIGHGRFLSCMGGTWHPECFVCHACRQPISDYEFSMSDNQPYHKSCYKELHHPKCDVCKNFIPTNAAGLIEYRAHPFWQQKYCPSHEHDGTPRCCSCERMEQVDAKYLILGDGRKLCLECLDSSIMDTGECQPLYIEIQEFYEGLLMKVEQQVPLLLVERQALNEAMEGEKQGHHHMPETRGLCLSEEQTVSTILRRPRIGGDRIVDMFTRPYKLVRKCEVTAILILYGLPRLLTGSILAHEMMHAWLRLKGYNNLSPEVEEGICQVLAHMWLDSEIISGSGSSATSTSSSSSASPSSSSSSSSSSSTSSKKGNRSQFEKKLGEFFKHQIESDTSAAYGDGFREGNKSVLKYGLRRTLDHMLLTGCFP